MIDGDLVRLRDEHTCVGSVELVGVGVAVVRWYMTGTYSVVSDERLEVVGRYSGSQ